MLEQLLNWLPSPEQLLLGIVLFIVGVVVSLLLVGWVAVQLPVNYFTRARPPLFTLKEQQPILRVVVLIIKNLLGVVLVVLGVALSLPGVPGQGILTIFVGLLLLDFPGKFRIERWIVRLPAVNRAVNALRRRYGREPLQFDEE